LRAGLPVVRPGRQIVPVDAGRAAVRPPHGVAGGLLVVSPTNNEVYVEPRCAREWLDIH
jgi:hypothetical protein